MLNSTRKVMAAILLATQISMLGALAPGAARASTGPVNLVSLAYQGFLRDQGIPRAGTLSRASRFGRVRAVDLVEAGVEAGLLPASTLDDQGYLIAVRGALRDLVNLDADDN